MAAEIPLYLFSHQRKIANLFKKWVRHIESEIFEVDEIRYQTTLARAEFNCIYYEKDIRVSKAMLKQKEEELKKKFKLPLIVLALSPGGVAHERTLLHEDWVVDKWHPLEKAIYPDYFARRELRKQQYIEMWEKIHGPPKPESC